MREVLDASEAIRPNAEARKHLCQDQIDAISIHSVEKEKAKTSDDQLWSKLLDVYNREIQIQSNIDKYGHLAQTTRGKERDQWEFVCETLRNELKFKDEYIRLIAWHLSMRGQNAEMVQFLKERALYEREHKLAWVNGARSSEMPTLHLVR